MLAASNSSGLYYTRGERRTEDELVYELARASLDDLSEEGKSELIDRPEALVADENYLSMCSPYGIHRFSVETPELAP